MKKISPINIKRYYKKEIKQKEKSKSKKSIEIDQKYCTKDKKIERSLQREEKSPFKEEKSPEKEEKIEIKSRKRKYLEREKEKNNVIGANKNEELITIFKENK